MASSLLTSSSQPPLLPRLDPCNSIEKPKQTQSPALKTKSHQTRPNSISSYRKTLENGLFPDNFTFPSLLKSLGVSRALLEGKLIHAHVIKMGFSSDIYTRNSLMRFYSLCGQMGFARNLFDRSPDRDLVSWTVLISGYSMLGFFEEAVSVFVEMVEGNLTPDAVTMVTVISAASRLKNLELGRKLHKYINVHKVNSDVFVENALVDMYLKCRDVRSAYKSFERMPRKNLVSWNSMICGLMWNGEFKEALSLFRRMQDEGLKPDGVTLVGVLKSCANLGALELGEWVHSYMDRVSIVVDGIIGNALVDMYAKCGRIERAVEVFHRMGRRDVYTYTTMIVGLAMHGQGKNALSLFTEMLRECIKPNGVTFIGVLSACNHSGLVDQGLRHFEDMVIVYGLTPLIEHYGCVVDMLGRAGLLYEAQAFVERMPIEPDALVWGSLLGACMVHGRVSLGESIATHLLELEPDEDGGYVLMSNIYASANQRREQNYTRKAMKKKKVKKTPGCSLIEVDGVIHEFRRGDKSHPQRGEIHMMVEKMGAHLRSKVYEPSIMDVSDYEFAT